jgi:Protein phosphatase 2C
MTGAEFNIGNPGRAAAEVPEGGLPSRIGPADVEFTAAALPGMRIRAASSRGVLHRAKGTSRQDAFGLGQVAAGDASGRLIAVVCDGVGQFGRSAEAAIATSWRLAELGVEGQPWPAAFAVANEELTKMAADAHLEGPGDDASGMATTAVAVSVWPDGDGWAGEVAWVGDSTLWHLSLESRWTLITDSPDAGEAGEESDYHSSAVRPLPSPDGRCTLREFQAGPGALFVMTDGVANPLLWSDDVQETLAQWWIRPPDPFTFAAQVGFARKGHMDDRTVIGIWPDPGGADDSAENRT